MKYRLGLVAAVALGALSGGGITAVSASDAGLYGRTGHLPPAAGQRRALRPSEHRYLVRRDDRGVVACYTSVYYPAEYVVNPRGRRVVDPAHNYVATGPDTVVERRSAPVYVETRHRIKEDFVSLRRVRCK